MRKVHERLFVGAELDCFHRGEGWATVHACKSPCHQRAVGYRKSLSSSHPNYLVLEEAPNLYLNMIDPPVPLFMPPLFSEFLRFASAQWNGGKHVLIHCNQGESRAPSLALLFLAKVLGVLPVESFDSAREAYLALDPEYSPGHGIQTYLREHWNDW